jgi:hypothetical protein
VGKGKLGLMSIGLVRNVCSGSEEGGGGGGLDFVFSINIVIDE